MTVSRRAFLALGVALPLVAAWAPTQPDLAALGTLVRTGIERATSGAVSDVSAST